MRVTHFLVTKTVLLACCAALTSACGLYSEDSLSDSRVTSTIDAGVLVAAIDATMNAPGIDANIVAPAVDANVIAPAIDAAPKLPSTDAQPQITVVDAAVQNQPALDAATPPNLPPPPSDAATPPSADATSGSPVLPPPQLDAGVADATPADAAPAAPSLHVTWTHTDIAYPEPSIFSSMAFDQAHSEMVLVTGMGGGAGDTWTWDGTKWTFYDTAAVIGNRYVSAMAYDEARGQVIMFGGYSSAVDNDTWAWDGSAWNKLSPANSPPARTSHTMVYDRAHQQIVMFGGNGTSSINQGLLNDTWLWDGTNWTQASPTTSPSARTEQSMAWDDAHQCVLMFGGITGGPSFNIGSSETWTWDGSNWTLASPSFSPPPISQAPMVYDPNSTQVVLFSGWLNGYGFVTGPWTWDGSNWTQWSNPSNVAPPGSFANGAAYDGNTKQIQIYGGYIPYPTTFFSDQLWAWQASGWSLTTNPTEPFSTYSGNLAYDHTRDQLVAWGGYGPNGECLRDTGTWDGISWTMHANTTAPLNGYCFNGAMVDDQTSEAIVAFGGFGGNTNNVYGNTWTWDGAQWTDAAPATNPPAREDHMMAYDANHGLVVMFGGNDGTGTHLGDTWTWDGVDWTQQNPEHSPSARYWSTMAYDEATQTVVLFGGNSQAGDLNDTWTWDGTDWTQQSPSSSPGSSERGASVYDPDLQKVIMLGGTDGGFNEMWLWDGSNWTQGPSMPFGSMFANVAFDDLTDSVEVTGAFTGQSNLRGVQHMQAIVE